MKYSPVLPNASPASGHYAYVTGTEPSFLTTTEVAAFASLPSKFSGGGPAFLPLPPPHRTYTLNLFLQENAALYASFLTLSRFIKNEALRIMQIMRPIRGNFSLDLKKWPDILAAHTVMAIYRSYVKKR